jgi:hypothetical protein
MPGKLLTLFDLFSFGFKLSVPCPDLLLCSIDICPSSEERSYEDAGRCIICPAASMPPGGGVPLRLNLGILKAPGTMSCMGICMAANGIALNFFNTGAVALAGSRSFCRAKRHINAWLPAFWRVQFGMTTGSCHGDVGLDMAEGGDKGKVKE